MAVAVRHDWRVKINDRYSYRVTAPYQAEAAHQAVIRWREDERLAQSTRQGFVWKLEAECLNP